MHARVTTLEGVSIYIFPVVAKYESIRNIRRGYLKKKVVLFALFEHYGCCAADPDGGDYAGHRNRGPGRLGR